MYVRTFNVASHTTLSQGKTALNNETASNSEVFIKKTTF
jgi:hypothetical protein